MSRITLLLPLLHTCSHLLVIYCFLKAEPKHQQNINFILRCLYFSPFGQYWTVAASFTEQLGPKCIFAIGSTLWVKYHCRHKLTDKLMEGLQTTFTFPQKKTIARIYKFINLFLQYRSVDLVWFRRNRLIVSWRNRKSIMKQSSEKSLFSRKGQPMKN